MNSYFKESEQVDKMREFGVEPNGSVIEALKEVGNPCYKIAFVGKFQVGKSHILNKVFLNDENLLAEGVGLCKTAVTVEINHGSETQFSYCNGEQIDIVTNPSNEIISKITAATEDEERVQLFNSIDNAILTYPNEILQNVSVYDTPGIDDPNEELLRETTYKLLPFMDMVVMVIAPKMLSQVELRFLQKKVFTCGIGRFMIVVSCKPTDLYDEADKELLKAQLQNQLRIIGKTDIPIYFYQEEVRHDLVCEKTLADEIIENAQRFTLENRCTKFRQAMCAQLSDEIAKLMVVSSIYGKNQNELNQMKSHAIQSLNELRQIMTDLQSEFTVRLSQCGTHCIHSLTSELKVIREKFILRLNDADGLGEAQELLAKADVELQRELEDVFVLRMQGFYDTANKLLEELKGNIRKCWQVTLCPLMFREINGGVVQDWNSSLVTLSDYIFSCFVLPGGFFLSIGLRWILGKIPVIKTLMPANLAKGYMISVAEESLDEQILLLIDEFSEHIVNEQDKICKFLANANQKEIEHQQSLLDAIINKECQSDTEVDILTIQKKMNDLGNLLEQIA